MSSKKKLFILGDSIFIYYRLYLKDFLENYLTISSKLGYEEAFENLDFPNGMNTGDSRMTLQYLKEQESMNEINYDYFAFNCGLHDIKRNFETNKIQVEPLEYERNLTEIIKIMKRKNIRTIFINTTPVIDEIHNKNCPSFQRFNKDEIYYNKIAENVMKNENVPIIDLNSFTKSLKGEIYKDHVHFNTETARLQAAYVAGAILALINN